MSAFNTSLHLICIMKPNIQSIITTLFLLLSVSLIGQNKDISGNQFTVVVEKLSEKKVVEFLYCTDCGYSTSVDLLPRFFKNTSLDFGFEASSVTINILDEEIATGEVLRLLNNSKKHFENDYELSFSTDYYRKKPMVSSEVLPIRKDNNGQFYLLRDYNIDVKQQGAKSKRSASNFNNNSVLGASTWYKIGVSSDGIYKLNTNLLSQLGIDESQIDPSTIRVFGNGGGVLPIGNSSKRIDDLEEIPLLIDDGNDGVFNNDDNILFYAQGPHQWKYLNNNFSHKWNIYTDTNYYFISLDYDIGTPKRIGNVNTQSNSGTVVSQFIDHQYYERDLHNLIKSGKTWFGEKLGTISSLSIPFVFENIVLNKDVKIVADLAVRSLDRASDVVLSIPNTIFSVERNFDYVIQDYTTQYATLGKMELDFKPNSPTVNISLKLSDKVSNAVGWLNYIEVFATRELKYNDEIVFFRDIENLNSPQISYQLESSKNNLRIWDVTSHNDVKQISASKTNNLYQFSYAADTIYEFVAFNDNNVRSPTSLIGKVENQNLHAQSQAEMLIITHRKFLSHAEQLAEFHREVDTLLVNVTTCDKIYNEFSSGKQDITAIKDYVRMFYERAGSDSTLFPQYLLLFGDASYDYKDVLTGNTNLVPTYQSNNVTAPTTSHVTDDYFGLLDPNEGESISHKVDIGIGRLPVQTTAEATNAVAKIKRYYEKSTFGAWRNITAFVADDEDGNLHNRDCDKLALYVDTNYAEYNVDKIYFDTYKQESTPGGKRYPQATEDLLKRVNQGALMLSYVGHGGELGWAHERVLEVPHINQFTNKNKLPLWITATCEFTRFDDPSRVSAGEYVFLNPDGGGIGLLTTTRLVYSTPNFDLAREFNKVAYKKTANGKFPRIGDLNRITKVNAGSSINNRCFSLIGDPALKLAYPKMNVIASEVPDTMRALDKITISGYVADYSNTIIPNYNGIVYPTVYAQMKSISTLNNDGDGVFGYGQQKDVIFKGKASARNGSFEFSFVVPKDIDLEFGTGKVSFYSDNAEFDANGVYESHQIGGVSANAPDDNTGPDINLFLNDENFVSGGLTDNEPMLFAKLFDENGINTVGNGVGHDVVATIDGNTANSIVLNDYYESELDSYQKGVVRFSLSNLEDGPHTIKLKAWDVLNNSDETEIDFVVANDKDLIIEHLLNYPNPFTTKTGFYFEHNQPGQNLQVRLQIFTVAGRLVKTIDQFNYSPGFRVGPIAWDGLDQYGDFIGKGVYVYKVSVTSPTGKNAEKFERLVVLK